MNLEFSGSHNKNSLRVSNHGIACQEIVVMCGNITTSHVVYELVHVIMFNVIVEHYDVDQFAYNMTF